MNAINKMLLDIDCSLSVTYCHTHECLCVCVCARARARANTTCPADIFGEDARSQRFVLYKFVYLPQHIDNKYKMSHLCPHTHTHTHKDIGG